MIDLSVGSSRALGRFEDSVVVHAEELPKSSVQRQEHLAYTPKIDSRWPAQDLRHNVAIAPMNGARNAIRRTWPLLLELRNGHF